MRKRNAKFRMKHPDGIYSVVNPTGASQDYTPEQAWEIVEPIRVALQSLLDGTAEDAQYRRVGSALNVAAIRAEQIAGNDDAVQVLQAASFAMLECLRIKRAHGRYGLTGPAREAIKEGIDLYETILRGSTPRQMYDAERELERALAKKPTNQKALHEA